MVNTVTVQTSENLPIRGNDINVNPGSLDVGAVNSNHVDSSQVLEFVGTPQGHGAVVNEIIQPLQTQ